MDMQPPIVLFDGACNLCNKTVQFIIKNDPKAAVKFASLQSEKGRQVLTRHHLATNPKSPDSIVFVEKGKAYQQSTAALKIALHLRKPWHWLGIFLGLPAALRDPIYTFIARNRYRWWGHTDECWLPDDALKSRFL
ncbi:MAG: DCC1-like thiol-disulfide oxidoreductase family protein [Edaphocola sp.]